MIKECASLFREVFGFGEADEYTQFMPKQGDYFFILPDGKIADRVTVKKPQKGSLYECLSSPSFPAVRFCAYQSNYLYNVNKAVDAVSRKVLTTNRYSFCTKKEHAAEMYLSQETEKATFESYRGGFTSLFGKDMDEERTGKTAASLGIIEAAFRTVCGEFGGDGTEIAENLLKGKGTYLYIFLISPADTETAQYGTKVVLTEETKQKIKEEQAEYVTRRIFLKDEYSVDGRGMYGMESVANEKKLFLCGKDRKVKAGVLAAPEEALEVKEMEEWLAAQRNAGNWHIIFDFRNRSIKAFGNEGLESFLKEPHADPYSYMRVGFGDHAAVTVEDWLECAGGSGGKDRYSAVIKNVFPAADIGTDMSEKQNFGYGSVLKNPYDLASAYSDIFFGERLFPCINFQSSEIYKEMKMTPEQRFQFASQKDAMKLFIFTGHTVAFMNIVSKNAVRLIVSELTQDTNPEQSCGKRIARVRMQFAYLAIAEKYGGKETCMEKCSEARERLIGLVCRGNEGRLENSTEFSYLAGALGNYLENMSAAKEKTFAMSKPLFAARTPAAAVKFLTAQEMKYGHRIQLESRAAKALKLLMEYSQRADAALDAETAAFGFVDNNMFYTKTKTAEAEKTEEE